MRMKKILIAALSAVALFTLIYTGVSLWNHYADDPSPTPEPARATTQTQPGNGKTVRISLDEWVGWQSLIDANGGLKTAPGSINARKGISVEYVLMNNHIDSSSALINGATDGAGYTVNRYAFLQDKFDRANLPVVMPFITNYSNGGDGIIAGSGIRTVTDLLGKRIGVPRYSEAQTLVEWLIRNSDLTKSQQSQIRESIVYFETADEAAKAFFSGNLDAAATWEPYLTQARTTTGAHVLFDTGMSANLILDGIVFRADFLESHADFVTNLIDGALEASSLYKKEFRYIKSFPMFSLMTDEEIISAADGANLATWADNAELLTGTAVSMYRDMATIWSDLGEAAHPDKAQAAFDARYVQALAGKYPQTRDAGSGRFTDQTRQQTQQSSNQEALLKKTLNINFEADSFQVPSSAYDTLNEFAEVAKILDGVYIQIEGNTAKVATGDGVDFSYKRALSVAKYLQVLGVDARRFIIVGNGDKNPVADNATEQGKAANRRTEIYFKSVVGY